MKRDMDLLRAILLRVEEEEEPSRGFLQMPGYDQEAVARHVVLLMDQGLVEASLIGTSVAPIGARVFRLTMAGHDFPDAVRNDTVWRKTKAFVAEKGGAATFEIVKAVAVTYLKAHIGIPEA